MTKDIQKAVGKYFAWKNYEVVENVSFSGSFEMDVCAVSQSNMLHEIEVKISRSDFKADAKKGKWARYTQRLQYSLTPNYFYYCCPTDLIKLDEIPTWSGLIYYDNGNLNVVKRAKRIHPEAAHELVVRKMLRLHTQRHFLGGAMLTVMNRRIREANKRQEDYADNRDAVCDKCGRLGEDHQYPNYKCA